MLDNTKMLKIYTGFVCNYRCSYCSAMSDLIKGDYGNLIMKDIDDINRCIDEKGITMVSILGGEPFVFKDILYKLKEFVINKNKGKNIYFQIITNGSLMSKFDFEYFNDINFKISIQSLNGPEKSLKYLIDHSELGYDIIKYIRKLDYKAEIARVILYDEGTRWYNDVLDIKKVFPNIGIGMDIDSTKVNTLTKEKIDEICDTYLKLVKYEDMYISCIDVDSVCKCSDINKFYIGKGFISDEKEDPSKLVIGCNSLAKDMNYELFEYLRQRIKAVHRIKNEIHKKKKGLEK